MPILITVSQTVQAYGDSLENWASPVPPFKQVYFRKENENENYAVILQKRERELMAGQIENEIKIKIARTKTRTIAVKKRGDHEFSISPATARSVVIAYCGHSAEFGHTVSYPLGMLVLGLGLAWPGLAWP